MNDDIIVGADATPVVLARTPPFDLAHVTVTPAALSLSAAGWSRRLEPRAMQVLVALAQAAPAVVGRDTLNTRVWGGRVVGEDAINRAVQTLRRVVIDAPPPVPFGIETIPRVGYRLTVAPPAPAQATGAPPAAGADAYPLARTSPRRRAGRAAGWMAAAALAVVAAILLWRAVDTREPTTGRWAVAGATMLDDLPVDARDVTVSPDGRRLAYRGRDARRRERIFVRAVRGGGTGSPVSPPEVDVRRPAWSPDGTMLAFSTYDPGRPCNLYVVVPGRAASPRGTCETVREPHLAWSADGGSLLFGDAPGENGVQRIGAVRLADGRREVLSSPPADSMGDGLPVPRRRDTVFQRQFGWADEGWIARDRATGTERLLWHRRGVAGSVAAPLPGGALAVAWTRAGTSGIDIIGHDGRVRSQPVAVGPVTALSVAGTRLLVEIDRVESGLARADTTPAVAPLVMMRGRIAGPVLLSGDRLRFPVASAGVARLWERDAAGLLRPWGPLTAARIVAPTPSPDGRLTAVLVTGNAGREIVVLDAAGRPTYRWTPHARSLNPAAWSGDGRRLIVPVLDGAGWRLFTLDPFGGTPPSDFGHPGFAVVLNDGPALYAARAGETTGPRELWRLDGPGRLARARRLPIDLPLIDVVNWRPVADGVWLPDRRDRDRPRLVLRDIDSGRILRDVAAPGLAGAASGLAADARGPVYVKLGRDAPEYALIALSRTVD